jgi:octaprenyl-diphosphate synthase
MNGRPDRHPGRADAAASVRAYPSGARSEWERTDLYALIEEFFRTSFHTDNPVITEAVRRMLAAGGKRLRPRVLLLAVDAAGGDPREQLALAAYMELIHVATLIHDDVVDRADTRRGVNATAVDFGNRISVLAGDYLFAWIFRNVTANYPDPVPHILSATLAEICDGEVLQLRALGNVGLSTAEYVDIVLKKTASLFAASAECGAIMGGGSALRVKALRDFGLYYGIAFQMLDDLLDATASEAELGKPVGNDLRERKMTIPLILALESGDAELREQIERFYTDGAADDGIGEILAGIARAGGVAKTREAIQSYVERAKQSLAPLGNAPARANLVELADALVLGGERASR